MERLIEDIKTYTLYFLYLGEGKKDEKQFDT